MPNTVRDLPKRKKSLLWMRACWGGLLLALVAAVAYHELSSWAARRHRRAVLQSARCLLQQYKYDHSHYPSDEMGARILRRDLIASTPTRYRDISYLYVADSDQMQPGQQPVLLCLPCVPSGKSGYLLRVDTGEIVELSPSELSFPRPASQSTDRQ